MSETYTSLQIRTALDIGKPLFDQYLSRNIARPEVRGRGRGNASTWVIENAYALGIAVALGKLGLDLHTAADVAEHAVTVIKLVDVAPIVAVDVETMEYTHMLCDDMPDQFKNFITSRDMVITFKTEKIINDVRRKL